MFVLKYMKNYDKNKEPSYLKYWGVYDLYGWVMSQKVPANEFKWVEETSQFNDQNLEKLQETIAIKKSKSHI